MTQTSRVVEFAGASLSTMSKESVAATARHWAREARALATMPLTKERAAAAIALLAAITMALLPVASQQTSITWTPEPRNLGPLPITAVASPESLRTELACQKALELTPTNGSPFTLFSTSKASNPGSLKLVSEGKNIYWGSVPSSANLGIRNTLPARPSPECRIVATYERSSRLLALEIDSRTASLPNAYSDTDVWASDGPTVNAPFAPLTLQGQLTMSVSLRPSTIDWPAWRWLLLLTVLGATLVIARPQFRKRAHALRSHGVRLARIDVAVALTLLSLWFLNSPLYDDGWVVTTVREYSQVGFFSNYFSLSAAPQPIGFWWTWVQQPLLSPDTPLWFMRLYSLVVAFLTWYVVRRFIVDRLADPHASRQQARLAAAATFVIFSVAWLPSQRPEVVVNLLLAIALALAIGYSQRSTPSPLNALAVVCALAISAHQTGVIILAVGFWMVVSVISRARGMSADIRRGELDRLMISGVLGLSWLIGLLMLHSNARVAADSSAAFGAQSSHAAMFDEMSRVFQFNPIAGANASQLLTLLATAFAVVAYLLREDKLTNRAVALICITSLGLLLLTPSKWSAHLAAIATVVSVLMAVAFINSPSWGLGRRQLALVGAATGLWLLANGGVAFSLSRGSSNFARLIAAAILLVGLLVISRRLAHRGRHRSIPNAAVPLALVALMGITQTAIAASQVPPAQGSFQAQPWATTMVDSLKGGCGVLDKLEVPTDYQPLRPFASGISASVTASEYGVDEVHGLKTITAKDPAQLAQSDWYPVGALKRVQFWVMSEREQINLDIDFMVNIFNIRSAPVQVSGRPDSWRLVRLDVPSDTTFMRVFWDPTDGIARITPMIDATVTRPADEIKDMSVWRNPDMVLQLPCTRTPSIADGTFGEFEWAFGQPLAAPTGPRISPLDSRLTIIEEACIPNYDSKRTCLMRASRQAAFGMVTEPDSVSR